MLFISQNQIEEYKQGYITMNYVYNKAKFSQPASLLCSVIHVHNIINIELLVSIHKKMVILIIGFQILRMFYEQQPQKRSRCKDKHSKIKRGKKQFHSLNLIGLVTATTDQFDKQKYSYIIWWCFIHTHFEFNSRYPIFFKIKK